MERDVDYTVNLLKTEELERRILGTMLSMPEVIPEVIEKLKPSDFSSTANRTIYKAIVELFNEDEHIDGVIVKQYLENKGLIKRIGGVSYLADLELAATFDVLDRYISFIKDKATERRVKALFQEGLQILGREDIHDIIAWAVDSLLAMEEVENGAVQVGDKAKEILTRRQYGGSDDGVMTGFSSLDRYLGGMRPGELIMVAGATSMGKSAFVLNVALNLALKGTPVMVFSLEMSSDLWSERVLSYLGQVDWYSTNSMDIDHLWDTAEKLKGVPLWIDDNSSLDLVTLRAKILRKLSSAGIRLVIVDYLQKMVPPKGLASREQEITALARGVKNIARDLNIPIIAVAQLSRNVDRREDHRPRLGDLRESGALEHESDVVLFIYRPEYYGIYEVEIDGERKNVEGMAEVIIAKHRRGPIGSVYLRWYNKYSKFEEVEDGSRF